jgi:hypothetical protein
MTFARGLDGTKWKVKLHKLTGEEPAWTDEEAAAVTGKTVSFSKDKFKIGETSCKLKITPQQDGKRWTAGETNPCTGDEKLRGMVYALSYENCPARFPGTIALSEKQAVAFGDGVSFCLEKK